MDVYYCRRLVRIRPTDRPGYRRAQAMPRQYRSFHPGIAHDRLSGARKIVHAVSDLRLIALTMPRKIESDHAIPLRKVRELIAPIIDVARPSMNQHQRLVALAIVHIVYACAIERGEARISFWSLIVLGCGSVRLRRSCDRRCEQQSNSQPQKPAMR